MNDITSADFRARLESLQAQRFTARTREEIASMNRDPSPGYYVSAMNDAGARMLAEGPFETHAEALCAEWGIAQAWAKVDYRAPFYAWGTARVREK